MIDPAAHLVIMRGGGDLATGAAWRLHRAGFPLIVLELARPLVVRRQVALATAILEGHINIEGLVGRQVDDHAAALAGAGGAEIPVLASPELPPALSPSIIIDARMAKRNIDTNRHQAPLVIALGPGFTAGVDCHAVVETMRGHTLGRVIWAGQALPNTGTPGEIGGRGAERVLRAPGSGPVEWRREIGERVVTGEVIGSVNGRLITAPFEGVIRGLIASRTEVRSGLKIGDIDPRADVSACFTISDKALAIGGGVLEAILTHIKGN